MQPHKISRFFRRVLGITDIKQQIERNQKEIMKTLNDIRDTVRAENTIIAGLVVFITGLQGQVKDALAAKGFSADDQKEIDDIFEEAQANRGALANALTANTASDAAPLPPGTEAPPPPTAPAPAAADTSAPAPGTSTVVDDAVAQAAQKAGTALGEVIEAVQAGEDHAQAVDDLKTAHAELAGVNDNDTAAQEKALAQATQKLADAEAGSDEAKAAVEDLKTPHNDLIEAASAPAATDPAPAP